MAVNGIEQQHKLNTFNMRNLWHNLGITWKDGESCQNKITNHVHHHQTKTSLAWTCRKNGRWMHPKRPFLWRNEKGNVPSRGLWMCVNETWRAPNTLWPLGGNCLWPWIMEGWNWVELLNKTRGRHQKRQQQRGVAVYKQRTAQSIDFKSFLSFIAALLYFVWHQKYLYDVIKQVFKTIWSMVHTCYRQLPHRVCCALQPFIFAPRFWYRKLQVEGSFLKSNLSEKPTQVDF